MIRQDQYESQYQERREMDRDGSTQWWKCAIEVYTRQTRECYVAGLIPSDNFDDLENWFELAVIHRALRDELDLRAPQREIHTQMTKDYDS